MYDIVRWIILGLLFVGLFGLWFWSKRQARANGPLGKNPGSPLRVTQKRWIDKGTGVCLRRGRGRNLSPGLHRQRRRELAAAGGQAGREENPSRSCRASIHCCLT